MLSCGVSSSGSRVHRECSMFCAVQGVQTWQSKGMQSNVGTVCYLCHSVSAAVLMGAQTGVRLNEEPGRASGWDFLEVETLTLFPCLLVS